MNVFVTGASGFVGEEILQHLHAAGHKTRILVRSANSASTQRLKEKYQVEAVPGDVTDAASLAGTLGGMEAVIHLVGIISENGKITYERVHVEGIRNVVDAAQSAGVKRHVQMSALGTRPNAVARYHQTKWAAEEIVRGSGLDWTIFRPSLVYGKRDHFVNLFNDMAKFSPVLPVIGAGKSLLQPVPVKDVAFAFVGALNEPRSVGQTFDLAGKERLTFEEVLDAILRVTRRRRAKVHIPLPIARAQAALLEFVYPKLLGKAPPLNRDQIKMLQEDNVGDPEPADQLFGIKPIGFEAGLSEFLS